MHTCTEDVAIVDEQVLRRPDYIFIIQCAKYAVCIIWIPFSRWSWFEEITAEDPTGAVHNARVWFSKQFLNYVDFIWFSSKKSIYISHTEKFTKWLTVCTCITTKRFISMQMMFSQHINSGVKINFNLLLWCVFVTKVAVCHMSVCQIAGEFIIQYDSFCTQAL